MNFKSALEEGILKREFKDLSKSKKSLEMADKEFNEAKNSLNADLYDPCIVFSYTSMFHAGRSLLFKEGYREKGHLGVIIFLKEFYAENIGSKLLYELDRLRRKRHEVLYGLEMIRISEEEAKQILNTAENFIKKIKELL